MKYNKIFVIGYNKTATTTFANMFEEFGLTSLHSANWGDYENINKIQCFSDGDRHTLSDNCLYFTKLDKNYPNSLFILNVRNLDSWLLSRTKHALRNIRAGKPFKKTYWPPCSGHYQQWIEERIIHYNNVLQYFKDCPKKLLIINIEKKHWTEMLADHLGFGNTKYLVKNRNRSIKENNPDLIFAKNVLEETFRKLNYTESDKKSLNLSTQLLTLYKNNIL